MMRFAELRSKQQGEIKMFPGAIQLMCRDRICLITKNKERIDNIPASVQNNKIHIMLGEGYENLIIEEGDSLIRNLSNRGAERYVVIKANFSEGAPNFGIPANYTLEVEKTTKPKKNYVPTISAGDNARIIVNSTDNSVNIQITQDNMWEQLVEVIKLQCNNQSDLLKLVAEMKETKGTPKFKEKYQAFIASAANHMTVFAPFIPVLSSWL